MQPAAPPPSLARPACLRGAPHALFFSPPLAQAHAAPLAAGAPELGPPVVAGVGVVGAGGAEGGGALVGVGPAEALVSADEEAGMAALLGSYTLGIGQAEAFSERLRRELAALEAANVHAILESEPLVDAVLAALDEAAGRADDMDETLAVFNAKLRHMREDIEAVSADAAGRRQGGPVGVAAGTIALSLHS